MFMWSIIMDREARKKPQLQSSECGLSAFVRLRATGAVKNFSTRLGKAFILSSAGDLSWVIQCCVIQGLQEFGKIVHDEEILFNVAVLGMRLLQFCRPSDAAIRGGGVVEGRKQCQ
jgi:hypothetical protein